ncbi:MAG: serine/threonine protein kinase, partial [Verrucomicrobia bacterium]|nr:serine/threonine protein kinase [Verrucomicrobiota bacterium]
MRVKQWTLTVHDSRGARSEVEAGEREFILGSESAFGVMRVVGEGVAPRHAKVKYGGERLVVEALGGETFVNGSPIQGRVEVDYPASVEVGDVTLVVEPVSNEPPPDRIAVTIPLPVRKKPEPLPEPEPPPTPEALAARIAITIPAPVKKEPVTPAPAAQAPPTPDFDIHLAETMPLQRKPAADDPDATIIQPCSNAPGRGGRTESTRVAKAPLKGEYTLVKEIARGGMGQIYFGEDPQLEREVAVKVSSISEEGEDPRFTKEAEVLAQLAHPNVVPIYNIGVDGERRPFYAMKLVKGRTLQAVLNAIRDGDAAAVKEYPLATLLTIFRKVCDAMAFAHSKRILHRDLKPENIMVGEYGEVLVMDWGLAKVLGGQDVDSRNASSGSNRAGNSTARVNESDDFGMTM